MSRSKKKLFSRFAIKKRKDKKGGGSAGRIKKGTVKKVQKESVSPVWRVWFIASGLAGLLMLAVWQVSGHQIRSGGDQFTSTAYCETKIFGRTIYACI